MIGKIVRTVLIAGNTAYAETLHERFKACLIAVCKPCGLPGAAVRTSP